MINFANLFFLLFMSSTALFCTIHESYCTISTNIYLYLQYFQQKVFNFSKISGSQTDPQSTTSDFFLLIEYFEISNTFDKSWLWLPLLTCHVKMGWYYGLFKLQNFVEKALRIHCVICWFLSWKGRFTSCVEEIPGM